MCKQEAVVYKSNPVMARGSAVKERGSLIISIAAGVSLATLQESLPVGSRVVRVMPNLPCLVGECAAGYSCGSHATKSDSETVRKLLRTVGRAEEVRSRGRTAGGA